MDSSPQLRAKKQSVKTEYTCNFLASTTCIEGLERMQKWYNYHTCTILINAFDYQPADWLYHNGGLRNPSNQKVEVESNPSRSASYFMRLTDRNQGDHLNLSLKISLKFQKRYRIIFRVSVFTPATDTNKLRLEL